MLRAMVYYKKRSIEKREIIFYKYYIRFSLYCKKCTLFFAPAARAGAAGVHIVREKGLKKNGRLQERIGSRMTEKSEGKLFLRRKKE